MEPRAPSELPSEPSSDASSGDRNEEDPTDLLIRVDPAEISTSSLPITESEELPAGALLGEYRLEGLIGKGGMGFVYAAIHPLIGKRAAVKVLQRELCRDPLSVERFVNEARIVNRIGHPNIVDVFAFGQMADGRSYFVMEWLKGETLRARVARSRLGMGEIRAVVKALASALSAAHEQGVIHRDLKPDNVFLVELPGHGTVVKLLDFGVAKLVSAHHQVEQTASGAIIGTPQYISPEQAKSQSIDHRADTYALGAIVFEMLTGRPPFVSGSAMEVVAMHLMEPPPRPSELAPVPPELDDLVVAMLAKSPEERPALDEVAELFEQARWPEASPSRRTPVAAVAAEPDWDGSPPAPPRVAPDPAGSPPAPPRAAPDRTKAAPSQAAPSEAAPLRPRTRALLAASVVVTLAVALFALWRGSQPIERGRRGGSTEPTADAGGPPRTGPVAPNWHDEAPAGSPAAPAAAPATPAAVPAPAPAADASARAADSRPGGAEPAPTPGSAPEAGGSSRPRPPSTRPPALRPPTAAPAPATRTLRLVVEATDFVAKIDGSRVGASIELAPGKHRLRVCARGKRPYEREIEVASSDVTWRVELEPLRDDDLQCRE